MLNRTLQHWKLALYEGEAGTTKSWDTRSTINAYEAGHWAKKGVLIPAPA